MRVSNISLLHGIPRTPLYLNQPNNKTTYYYDEQVIDSPEDHIQQH